jgi:hypothetical protein
MGAFRMAMKPRGPRELTEDVVLLTCPVAIEFALDAPTFAQGPRGANPNCVTLAGRAYGTS